jgi:hypothetical protein
MGSVGDVISYAKAQLGKPYVFGASGPSTFDCSGLTLMAYRQAGITLPHHSQDQAKMGVAVAKTAIQPGDLVFSNWGDGPNSHVGIAVSGNQIIDAPHTGAFVRYDNLSASYLSHVTAVRRFPTVTGGGGGGGGGGGVGPGIIGGPMQLPGGGGGGGGGGNFWDPVTKPFQDMASAASSVAQVADLITKAFLPSNFTRIVCGLLGGIFILMGIVLLTREVRPV